MSLKLFRNTEFVQSSLISNTQDSQAMHPAALIVLASLWIAILGNLTLWQTLLQLPSDGLIQVMLRCVVLGLQIALAVAALLSMLAWRWLLKLSVVLLLILTAVSMMSMQSGVPYMDTPAVDKMLRGGLRAWLARSDPSWILPALALLIVPLLWLLPTPVRRFGFLRQLRWNIGMLIVSIGLLLGLAYLFVGENQKLMQIHPMLYEQLNPLSSLNALGRLGWDLLPASAAR